MKIDMAIKGLENIARNMEHLRKEYAEAVAQAKYAGGELVMQTAVKSIREVSPGREVQRTRPDGREYTHTVSKPGDAPNYDTGALVKSIDIKPIGKDVYVGSWMQEPYPLYLEYGTSRMEARPWLNPALEANRKKIYTLIKSATRRVSNKGR